MARIRTIKPEFWTSEQVTECSMNARLLFIGIWNFCDDAGRMNASPKQIKALVLPADDISSESVRGMLDELEKNGLLIRYIVDGKEFLQVTGWKHQKIDRPQPPKYPGPEKEAADHSSNDRRTFDDGREGKGEDRKGLEINPDSAAPSGRVLAEKPEVVIRSEIMAIVGDDMPPGDMNRPAMWLAQGYTLDLIRAVVVERFRAGKRPSSLAWFDKALAEAAAVKAPKPAPSGPNDAAWRSVMRRWVEEGIWHPAFGPPGGADCPAHIKAEFERAA